jgi:CheY-like chemotaxis protein
LEEGLLSASQFRSDDKPGRRRQILVVEDSKADLFLIREAISEAKVDADLHVVQDGEKAIEFLDQVREGDDACPDLVLIDLNLPRKNGTEVLRALRSRGACRDALVMIVTSSDSASDRAAVNALGLNGYFRKPSSYDEFLKLGPIVRDLLGSLAGSDTV